MSLGSSTALAVDRAVALVNLHVAHGMEILQDDLYALVRSYGFDRAELDVPAFAQLAHDLRDALADSDPVVRLQRINGLLELLQPMPRLAVHDDEGVYFRYGVSGTVAERIGAALVMAIATVVVEEGGERFGWCAAPACGRLFFDRSRNRSQRFCSRSCATRVHVRAHRARQ